MNIKEPNYIESDKNILLSNGAIDSAIDKIDYPIFCFRYMHQSYNIEKCLMSEKSFPKQFLKKIELISKLSWEDIKLADRQGHGTEKISKSSIHSSVPSSVTNDVKDFLSLYFNGKKGRIIGYRSKALFHIVYIDTKLDVYDH